MQHVQARKQEIRPGRHKYSHPRPTRCDSGERRSRMVGFSFVTGQAVATLVAMTTNFFLNNSLIYRDLRLRGRELFRGWLSFVLACSIGAIANVGIATYMFQAESYWVLSALAGILVGAVWNYAVTAVYTWRHKAA